MKNILRFGTLCLVIVLIFIIVGCGKKEKVTLIGTWEYFSNETVRNDIYYQFNKDKTGKYSFYGSDMSFTYEDDGKEITIKYDKDTVSSKYEYRIEDGKLIIKDSFGDDVTYKKK